jgi:hypothetical protein
MGEVRATLAEHGARLERIESTLTGHGEMLAGHGEMLRAILARLGGAPERGADD